MTAGWTWSTQQPNLGRKGLSNGNNSALSVLRWTIVKCLPVHEGCCGQQRTPHSQRKDSQSSERKSKTTMAHEMKPFTKWVQPQPHQQLQLQNWSCHSSRLLFLPGLRIRQITGTDEFKKENPKSGLHPCKSPFQANCSNRLIWPDSKSLGTPMSKQTASAHPNAPCWSFLPHCPKHHPQRSHTCSFSLQLPAEAPNAGHSYRGYQGKTSCEKSTVTPWYILTALAFNLWRLFLGLHQKAVDISIVYTQLCFHLFFSGPIHFWICWTEVPPYHPHKQQAVLTWRQAQRFGPTAPHDWQVPWIFMIKKKKGLFACLSFKEPHPSRARNPSMWQASPACSSNHSLNPCFQWHTAVC